MVPILVQPIELDLFLFVQFVDILNYVGWCRLCLRVPIALFVRRTLWIPVTSSHHWLVAASLSSSVTGLSCSDTLSLAPSIHSKTWLGLTWQFVAFIKWIRVKPASESERWLLHRQLGTHLASVFFQHHRDRWLYNFWRAGLLVIGLDHNRVSICCSVIERILDALVIAIGAWIWQYLADIQTGWIHE